MRVALLALVLCTGCAAGTIVRDDIQISGIALGGATLECCAEGGHIAPSTGEKDGSIDGPCARVTGGSMSDAFSGVLGAAISGFVMYFGGGG